MKKIEDLDFYSIGVRCLPVATTQTLTGRGQQTLNLDTSQFVLFRDLTLSLAK